MAEVKGPAGRLRRGLQRLRGWDKDGGASSQRRRRGLCVAVLGADGSGKSTLTQHLRTSYPGRVLVYKMRLHGVSHKGGRVVRWVAQSLRALKLATGARLAIRRGALVVWDRHPIEDDLATREGRRVLSLRHSWVRRIVPGPDIILVLDAPSAVLHGRRAGEHPLVLNRLRKVYLNIAEGPHRVLVLDATRSPQEVLADALREIERVQTESDGGVGTAS